jgi:hypothetical protein
MRGKKAGTKCSHCYKEKDIHHMVFDCTTARYIRKIVFKEWWSRTGDHVWSHNHGFKEAFFFKGSDMLEVAKCTLNDIAMTTSGNTNIAHFMMAMRKLHWQLSLPTTYG